MVNVVAEAQIGLVDALGREGFAQQALAALQPAVQALSWSVYALRPGQAPVLHLSATQHGADHTRDCFAAYARGLYLRDSSFDAVRRQPRQGQPVVTFMAADSAPNRDHREAIYRAYQVRERLSVAALQDDGSLLAVNLYHHEPQGPFTAAERERFQDLAGLLHTAVRRHLALGAARGPGFLAAPVPLRLAAALGDPPGDPVLGALSGAPAAAPVPARGGARARLLAAAPGLTPRELDVCERLLRGWSHDGVAADLGLSLATVKTYRARAFTRLGLHFRSELFARFGAAEAPG